MDFKICLFFCFCFFFFFVFLLFFFNSNSNFSIIFITEKHGTLVIKSDIVTSHKTFGSRKTSSIFYVLKFKLKLI